MCQTERNVDDELRRIQLCVLCVCVTCDEKAEKENISTILYKRKCAHIQCSIEHSHFIFSSLALPSTYVLHNTAHNHAWGNVSSFESQLFLILNFCKYICCRCSLSLSLSLNGFVYRISSTVSNQWLMRLLVHVLYENKWKSDCLFKLL